MGQGQRVIGYVRVSSEKQADHGVSLEAQQAKLTAYAALYELELVDIIVDAGVSAKTLNRPGLQQALHMLKSGMAHGLLVVKLDRLTRSVRDLGELLERYFTKYALMSVHEQIDTTTANGRMVLNLLMTVAQWEREIISERTTEALSHKRTKGEKLGGSVPYGYVVVDGVLVEDPSEQALLALIRRYRADGLSLRAITEELARKNYQTRKGTPFQVNQIVRMLKDCA